MKQHKTSIDESLLSASPHPENVRCCPDCGSPMGVISSSISTEFGWITVRRRRACPKCGTRIHTIEIQEDAHRRFLRAAKITRDTLQKALTDMETLR